MRTIELPHSKFNLQEQLADNGADRRHNLDQGIVDLGNGVSMIGEVRKSQHIRNEADCKDLEATRQSSLARKNQE